jgi:hypothetical protein
MEFYLDEAFGNVYGAPVSRPGILFATNGRATRRLKKACERPPHAQWARPAGQ